MMKKNVYLVAGLMLAAVAHAQVIFQADFETPTYSLGAISGQAGWTGAGKSVTGNGRDGSNGLQFVGPAAGDFTNATQSFAGAFSGDLTSSVDVWVGSDYTPGGPSRSLRTGYGFEISNGSSTTSVSYYLESGSNAGGTVFDYVTVFVDDTPVATEVVTLTRGAWTTLGVDYSLTTGALNFLYNGSSVSSQTGITGGDALANIYAQLANFNNNEGVGIVVNFDNFNFSAVPEPATFGFLAAFGAFAIVGARRRRGPASD